MKGTILKKNSKIGWIEHGWLLTVLLIVIVGSYSLLYFNNTYPISEGWGINYAELLFQGKVPYRDFYYYLPPLNLLIDALFWKLSFGLLLVFRGWYLLQRIVIYVLVFRLLMRFFNRHHAFLACALTAILATGDVYDLLGDYNQTMALLTVLLIYCAVSFTQSDKLRKKLLHLGLAGVVLGCLFLNKQTIFVACGLAFFLVLAMLCLLNRDKRFFYYCLAVVGGTLVPVMVVFGYLGLNGALVPFFEQVFINVDGKGSLFHILVYSVVSRLWMPQIWGIILLLAALFVLDSAQNNGDNKRLILAYGLLLCGLGVWVAGTYSQQILSLVHVVVKYRSAMAAFLFCIAVFAALLIRIGRKGMIISKERDVKIKALSVLCCLLVMISVNLYSSNFAYEFYYQGGGFGLVQSALISFVFLGSIALAIVLPIQLYNAVDQMERRRCEALLVINCGGFSLLYAGVMASGDSFAAAHTLRIALPFLLCILLSVPIKRPVAAHVVKGGVLAVCIVLAMSCVSQKVACSYSWWGSNMAPMSEKTYTVDIPAMAGIRVSKDQKELYETVTEVIQENTTEDAVIWGYPHIKLFNILTQNYNMDTFVPVLFYDVVADSYVEKEQELLEKHLPDVIIWEEIPGCKEAHENVFRDGEPLKQREIESYLEEVIPKKYTLMATVDNVSVYILDDSIVSERDAE